LKQTLAKTLYNKRFEKGLSMTEAAKEIGVNYVTYWRFETLGVTNISYKSAKKLAIYLDMPIKDVYDLC